MGCGAQVAAESLNGEMVGTSPIPQSKVCTRCGLNKPIDCYRTRPNSKLGHYSHCVDCDNKMRAARRVSDRERETTYLRMWRENNAEIVKLYAKVDTANKRSSEKISVEDIRWVVDRFGLTCNDCGTKDDPTIDHVHPLSKGGRNHRSNLQILCKSCNFRKGVSLPNTLDTTEQTG